MYLFMYLCISNVNPNIKRGPFAAKDKGVHIVHKLTLHMFKFIYVYVQASLVFVEITCH